MTIGMLCLLIPTIVAEIKGNPAIAKLGVAQATGAMEGKEVRFGPASIRLLEYCYYYHFNRFCQLHAR